MEGGERTLMCKKRNYGEKYDHSPTLLVYSNIEDTHSNLLTFFAMLWNLSRGRIIFLTGAF
jgi:hypothetical protein